MLVRIFEYATQGALDQGEIEGDTPTLSIPQSAVLFLRCTRKIPEKMKIDFEIEGKMEQARETAEKLQTLAWMKIPLPT